VEAVRRLHERAVWAAEARDSRNVRFIHGDALLDLTLPATTSSLLSRGVEPFAFLGLRPPPGPALGAIVVRVATRERALLMRLDSFESRERTGRASPITRT
jgi:hypothetical protein